MRRLIVTGDDFGASVPVNEAVERAHREGILTTASLMVGAEAAADAVERARRSPTLKVGLHIVLVCGRPLLPPADVPDLVDSAGRFSSDLITAGFRFFFRPAVRRQLEAEIRAQFEGFRETGLPLDHVNAHNHMQMHPTVFGSIVRIGREYGLRAVRVPYEPPIAAWKGSREGLLRRLLAAAGLRPWSRLMERRARREGLFCNDYVFGMHDTGGLTTERVLRLIRHLPDGVSEIYFHPTLRDDRQAGPFPAHYRGEDELAALLSPEVSEALRKFGVKSVTFSDMTLKHSCAR